MDDRKRRLQEHKDKLIADRAKERKEELMRTSFNGIIKDEENAAIVLDNEKKKQQESLEAAIARRNKGLKLEEKKQPKGEEDDEVIGDVSGFNDNYGDITISMD